MFDLAIFNWISISELFHIVFEVLGLYIFAGKLKKLCSFITISVKIYKFLLHW